MKAIFLFFLLALVSGCGNSSSSTGEVFDGKTIVVVSGDALTRTTTSLTGTGSVVFSSPLTTNENSFRPVFTLEDGGTFTLTAYGSAALATGVSVKFSRSGTTLSVSLLTDSGSTDVSSKFTGVDASTTLTFQVDMHNGEDPAHILIWAGSETGFSNSNTLLNSEDSGFSAPGKGQATLWGLALSSASVSAITLSGAKFED